MLGSHPLARRPPGKALIIALAHLSTELSSSRALCGLPLPARGHCCIGLESFAHQPHESRCQVCERKYLSEAVEVNAERTTVWVHTLDGSNVGRFSTLLGMDVHTTFEEQLRGGRQCLHCTHEVPSHEDWIQFCALMLQHYGVTVDPELLTFGGAARQAADSTGDELAQP